MLSSVKKSIVQASSSSISRIVNFSLGYGAAVGGFVLSAPLFMHARINNTFQLLLASLAPLLTTIIVFFMEYKKEQRSKALTTQINKDNQVMVTEKLQVQQKREGEELYGKLRKKFPDDYRRILSLLPGSNDTVIRSRHAIVKRLEVPVEVISVINRTANNTPQESCQNTLCYKHVFSALSITINCVASASSVYISFIIPVVLSEDVNSDDLQPWALVLGTLAAIQGGLLAFAMSIKSEERRTHQETTLHANIHEYCNEYLRLFHISKKTHPKSFKKSIIPEPIKKWVDKDHVYDEDRRNIHGMGVV